MVVSSENEGCRVQIRKGSGTWPNKVRSRDLGMTALIANHDVNFGSHMTVPEPTLRQSL